MRNVSKEEFYRVIGPQDVHPQILGPWPYTSLFKTRAGEVKGKTEDYLPIEKALTETRYWLMEGML